MPQNNYGKHQELSRLANMAGTYNRIKQQRQKSTQKNWISDKKLILYTQLPEATRHEDEIL